MVSLSSRQKDILTYLERSNGVLSSTILSNQFSVSVQTIRKDLNELSDKGMVKRVHGGICLPGANDNLSYSNRDILNLSAKQRIARQVVSELPEGISIFLGIGTTPKNVAHALLDHPGLTVVTNNINAALMLSRNPNIVVHLAGGAVRTSDEDTVGEATTHFYRQFNIKIGIFGAGGLGNKGQLLDFTPEEACLTRAIIEHSQQCWLVVDTTKLGRYAPIVSGQLFEIKRMFVDEENNAIQTLCQQSNTELVVCC
ncbi:DeoR/GlpR family DNA-binding transcription regulator [Vibrio aestuarianus]|nr:DeoR/GlpR family DNA-binding transcription regulator [Vibrio aestuarianus]MDE1212940.1 DeoR/GlpR family DNA-binding transcription regulator [Vibrio aestuarianus]MDE1216758.1 DeoR/GlpR family DNA-binding transcription regulator [Vibrio aestuarianus]MDE1228532.1 DeoR/GlpR family DNA-binding transcription regulator [Vibrio aestuarianus]MDE1256500.1 DeoR/GlpR family DNA-binding transcription regulator [Vibrio aestuarianus]MDE1260068.1 DeoR/GlpR family DNA-binding transcription regulator [Vibrio